MRIPILITCGVMLPAIGVWMLIDHSFWPPTRPDDDRFWTRPERWLEGAIFTPQSGYVSDPQLATHVFTTFAHDQFLSLCEVQDWDR